MLKSIIIIGAIILAVGYIIWEAVSIYKDLAAKNPKDKNVNKRVMKAILMSIVLFFIDDPPNYD